MTDALPPLPEPLWGYSTNTPKFSADQMHAYAREALAQPASGEPVAWRYALDASVEGPRWIYIDKAPHQWRTEPAMANAVIEPLHIAPQPAPAQARQPLPDEQINAIWRGTLGYAHAPRKSAFDMARAIEEAHGIVDKE